ncbi:protein tweety-like isoform X2 [Panonychus citri]|uniref:protein tweety-like isoform X2 n=1 Tax=Panonychus citri TaxID=50023 RepID=UPI0023081B9F|nr:protein tweety-like isoform X2 [Panonychus citri]XP_053207759.1 protein tweety-like isoform X2 [Panonychus citri]
MDLMDQFINSSIASPGGDYKISLAAKYFHQVPHKDIHFNWVNATFDLNDNQYQEALGIIVAIPGFWLILTLLFFLIFFLCRCCDVNSKKKKKLTCCKCFLFLFTILSIAVITVGLYGNYVTHEGMVKVQNSTSKIAQDINDLNSLTAIVDTSLEKDIHDNLNLSLNRVTGPIMKNYTLVNFIHSKIEEMKRNTNSASSIITEMRGKVFNEANFDQIENLNVPEKEMIRTMATWATLISLLFIGLILMCGVCRHSRCMLILFSVLGLLSLVICWVLTSIYIGFCVAVSDFCMDPKPFIYKYLPRETLLLNYYIKCDPRTTENIYFKQSNEILMHLDKVASNYEEIMSQCKSNCTDSMFKQYMGNIQKGMSNIRNKTDIFNKHSHCQGIHESYKHTMNHSCKDVLEGVSLMLASSSVTGLIFTLLVLCASHTWINIRIKRNKTMTGDASEETAPFLAPASASSTVSSSTGNIKRTRDNYAAASGPSSRPRYSHTPPQTPHFVPGPNYMANAPPLGPQSTNGRSVNRDEQLSFLTPPPSYEQVGQQGLQGHQMQHHHGHQPLGQPHYVRNTSFPTFHA